jgi:hypothetical protein
MAVNLTITEEQRRQLAEHLFPEDGCEAVAIVLCGRAASPYGYRLVARKVVPVPYDQCSVRKPDRVTWSTDILLPLLSEADRDNLSILKIHGHRGFDRFSNVDDTSDRALFPSVHGWVDGNNPHGSAILMDDGRCFGRLVHADGSFEPLSRVAVVGDDIEIFDATEVDDAVPEHARRVMQTFGKGTYQTMTKLRVGVVGCSGTGSPVVEQLARNCVGSLVLVDPDRVERKNLNRILNATMADALAGLPKVELAKRTVDSLELGTEVLTFATTLFDVDAVRALASCDILFGCMDSVDGRYALNKLASFYAIPYFDLGVRIDADGKGGVSQVCGTVHYLKPGGSSLLSRNLFTMEQVRVAGLYRTDPGQYQQLLKEGYIRGVNEDQPAVIQLNMLIASLGINEFLARLHPYRSDSNAEYAAFRVSLSHGIFGGESDGLPCAVIGRHVGRGDVEPLLDLPELSARGD